MAHETNSTLRKLFLLPLNKSLEKGDERSHRITWKRIFVKFFKNIFPTGLIEGVH